MSEPIVAQAVVARWQTLADGTWRAVIDFQESPALSALVALGPSQHLFISAQSLPAPDKPAPEKPKTKFTDLNPTRQAVLLCKSEGFQKWLEAEDEEDAAGKVRAMLGIQSRSELKNEHNINRWRAIASQYADYVNKRNKQNWKMPTADVKPTVEV